LDRQRVDASSELDQRHQQLNDMKQLGDVRATSVL